MNRLQYHVCTIVMSTNNLAYFDIILGNNTSNIVLTLDKFCSLMEHLILCKANFRKVSKYSSNVIYTIARQTHCKMASKASSKSSSLTITVTSLALLMELPLDDAGVVQKRPEVGDELAALR